MASRRPNPAQPPPPPKAEIDPDFFCEWFEFGWHELIAFLTLHARYEACCVRHHRDAE